MSTIRRQSIISSLVVYLGFALGLLNTYLFTREGGFTPAQYGLTNTFIAFASIMFSIAGLGMNGYINKFFPYYSAHLQVKENDQISWALLLPTLGFLVVVALGFLFKDLVVRIFNNSPELLEYYYWTFPFGFGYTIFMVLEAFAWQHRKAVLSNFLKEVLFRLFVTTLIILTTVHVIRGFDEFIGLYSFAYLLITIILLVYLYRSHRLRFNFSISKVTRRFYNKIVLLISFVWGGGLVFNLANVFDGIIIAAVLPNGMAAAGVYYLAQNISSLIQAPQRAVISASVGPLSQAWKDKDYDKINRIYHRSSINQLIFATAMFSLIWLNFEDGIETFKIQGNFMAAKWVFFFIGLAKIIDMGTGLNSQIIGTSTFWRFEFVSGIILLAITLPLNWQLTRYFGVVGPGISNLIAFTIYNLIRYRFLWKKFRMQPFTLKTVFALILAFVAYMISWWAFDDLRGLGAMILRSAVFSVIFVSGMIALKLTPDLRPVLLSLRKRIGFRD